MCVLCVYVAAPPNVHMMICGLCKYFRVTIIPAGSRPFSSSSSRDVDVYYVRVGQVYKAEGEGERKKRNGKYRPAPANPVL